ncbi:MAG: hypothetical protein KF746_05570 [Chitinophagaceae bacterium]|nr:hypothetical protein [Chitinophagaceae bacterium]
MHWKHQIEWDIENSDAIELSAEEWSLVQEGIADYKKGDRKTEVLELLKQTNDSTLIDEVYDILHPEATLENVNTKNLPVELQQKISKALEDYKSGNYITHEEMKQKVQQWLTK